MKKNAIALMLSLVMAVGSIGSSSAFAAETTAVQEASMIEQEETAVEQQVVEENGAADKDAAPEEASEGESVQVMEEGSDQEDETSQAAEEEPAQEGEAAQEGEPAQETGEEDSDRESETDSEEHEIVQDDASGTADTSETAADDEADAEMEEISDAAATSVEADGSAGIDTIEEEIIIEDENEAMAADVWLWPFPTSTTVNSGFRPPERPDHDGVDIGANIGDPIYAVNDGTIYKKYQGCNRYGGYGTPCNSVGVCNPNHGYYGGYCNNGYGNGICLKTKDGYYVQFAHMQSVNSSLYEGQYVTKGTLLGYVGGSGCATGKHCHYAVATGGEFSGFVNPMNMSYVYSGYGGSAPVNPTIKINKTRFLTTDTIRIDVSAEGAISYYGAIYKKDTRIWEGFCQEGGFIQYPANQFGEGEFSAYVTCSNDAGWVDTSWVNYTVSDEAPKNPTIKINKNRFLTTDTIRIDVSAEGAISYYGAIYKKDTRIWEGFCQEGGFIQYPANQFGEGEFSAYVTCSNDAGWVDTSWVNYTVAKNYLTEMKITGIVNTTYTGKEITQAVVVKDGTATLTKNRDYTVAYKNNTNVGTATVIITGIGNYSGTVEKTFEIIPKQITPAVVLSNTTFNYNGRQQMPDLIVKDSNTVLTEKDYDIKWPSDCVDPGEYDVTVTLKGNYLGTATETFTILPGKTSRGDMFNLANNVKVTWKEVPGAKYYKVYREGITDPSESLDEPVIVTERLIGWDKEPGLTNGHAYRYKIVASLTGKGDPSGDSPLSYSKLMYRLKTVVIRSVKNTAPGKVTVKYDKTTSGDSYVLQYCEREDMVGAKTKVVLGANNTSYVIGGLKKGKTYYISIRVRKKVDGIDYYTTFGVPKKITITQ